MKDGEIVESGTHEDLMALRGVYFSLILTKTAGKTEKDNSKSKNRDAIELESQKNDTQCTIDKFAVNDQYPGTLIFRMWELNKPEWFYILIGCLASTISGGINPLFSIIFSKIILVWL